MGELMSLKDNYWFDNWEQHYRKEISSDVKDAMILKALSMIVLDLNTIKKQLKIGEEE